MCCICCLRALGFDVQLPEGNGFLCAVLGASHDFSDCCDYYFDAHSIESIIRHHLSIGVPGFPKPLLSDQVKGVLRKIGSWDVALAQAREAFRSVDEKGKSCLRVRGTSDLAHLHALGHRAVAELIESVPRS